MNDEIINAAVMRLKSKALEHYGLLKSVYKKAEGTDTVDEMCKHAIALVQFEGAMLTLQQYAATLNQEPQAEEVIPNADAPITTEQLAERSPTYRKSQSAKKPKAKKKMKKDEWRQMEEAKAQLSHILKEDE